ncbi:MAG: hypothetical protein JNN04_04460 [Cyclobacteriaceae bacterium]|nr:hypothetical protein [Cyclobacteriaceae bacterium]
MNLVLPLLNVLLMAWLGYGMFRRQPDSWKRVFWPALGLKLVAGVCLGWLYLDHYGAGDTISFWQDGIRLSGNLLDRPLDTLVFYWDESLTPDLYQQFSHQGPRSLFFVKISGLLALAGGGQYGIMSAWLSFASFVASWKLYVRLCRFFPEMTTANALIILFFPSVVFWSSGLIKESLGLAALYLMMAAVLSMIRRQPLSALEIILLPISLWVGWNLKYYWLGIFLPVAIPAVIVVWMVSRRNSLLRYDLLLWLLFFLGCVFVATHLHPNFYASRILEVICQSNLEFTRLSEPSQLVTYDDLRPEAISVLMNVPAAIVAGLFRPFVWEAFHWLSWMASLENLLILLLLIQALPALRNVIHSKHRVLVVAGLTYALLLTAFLALSTPNFGTLSRYRIGALPVLLLLCLSPSTPLGRWLSSRRWFG